MSQIITLSCWRWFAIRLFCHRLDRHKPNLDSFAALENGELVTRCLRCGHWLVGRRGRWVKWIRGNWF